MTPSSQTNKAATPLKHQSKIGFTGQEDHTVLHTQLKSFYMYILSNNSSVPEHRRLPMLKAGLACNVLPEVVHIQNAPKAMSSCRPCIVVCQQSTIGACALASPDVYMYVILPKALLYGYGFS